MLSAFKITSYYETKVVINFSAGLTSNWKSNNSVIKSLVFWIWRHESARPRTIKTNWRSDESDDVLTSSDVARLQSMQWVIQSLPVYKGWEWSGEWYHSNRDDYLITKVCELRMSHECVSFPNHATVECRRMVLLLPFVAPGAGYQKQMFHPVRRRFEINRPTHDRKKLDIRR